MSTKSTKVSIAAAGALPPIDSPSSAITMRGPTGVRTPAFCGAEMQVPHGSTIVVRVHDWDLESYLDRMHRAAISLPGAEILGLRAFFLDAAQTEFDAEHLCRHLERTGMPLTPEFKDFEKAWRRDEYRHYVGFRRVFARLYPDAGESGLTATVEAVTADFAPIADLVRDEFSVLAAIIFDEACTAKSYGDQIPFYTRLGDPVFAEWIRHITRDEVNHMLNAMDVLRARHAARLTEFGALLDRLAAHDQDGPGYGNTFLFDHDGYSTEFIAQVVSRLKRQVMR